MARTKIVIVGGVAGGATAAARLRRLSEDAEIVMLERGPYISFANCGLPYHVGGDIAERDALLLQTPESLHARYNLDVRVRHEVLEIDRDMHEVVIRDIENDKTYRESYDKLLLSPGAAPLRPPLPGIDHAKIFTLRTVPDVDRIKAAVDAGAKSALVIGGGFIGLEMVENLVQRGLSVHLVEMLDQVMPPIDREMASPVHDQLRVAGVNLHLGDAVESFVDEGGAVRAKLKSGQELTGDLVVLAIGVRAESKLAKDAGLNVHERGAIRVNDHMQTSDPDIYAVGDAVTVTDWVTGGETLIPLAGPANRQGRIAADNMLGRDSAYRGTQGTSVVSVFDLTVALTGASEKTLQRAGMAYEKVYLYPSHHVGYYPGAAQMSVKLLFAPDDGRVLGAQIVGTEGVDKRIDVLAMAIQARMTVYDLEEVELAYAPQYGSAKDAVNMAGFVAANVLRGDVRNVHADALEGMTILDVRNQDEFDAGSIPGAMLIPLPELRKRHHEIPKDKPIAVHCQVGQRGYVAARLLTMLGYDARNVSGGYRTWRAFHPAGAPTGGPANSSNKTLEGSGGNVSTSSQTANSAAQGATDATNANAGTATASEKLDVCGKCCPGPIVAVADTLKRMASGNVLEVHATDAGFMSDIPAWCQNTGNELISAQRTNGHYVAMIRKGANGSGASAAIACGASSTAVAAPPVARGKTIVVFSGELDKLMAALIIANGAASMGQKVTLFFTFWGLNALRKDAPAHVSKTALERMFGWMMPRGASRLPMSRMHMGGMGKAMLNYVMRTKNVDPVETLLAQAKAQGVSLVACSMSLDVMGIKEAELIDGVTVGGVAAYLAEADQASANLFI
ncbi:MAG: FAD-dependent oxidoreductase [Phycisphaerales bacterium]|nr:FAD-dependent oxidoreductase [Phycisphaerales bacterium]